MMIPCLCSENFRKINPTYSLARRMLIYFRKSLLVSGSWAFIYSFVTFDPPFLMKQILEYVEDPSRAPANLIWLYVIGMLLFGILDNIVLGQSLYIGRRMCIRMRSIIIGEVLCKGSPSPHMVPGKEKKLARRMIAMLTMKPPPLMVRMSLSQKIKASPTRCHYQSHGCRCFQGF